MQCTQQTDRVTTILLSLQLTQLTVTQEAGLDMTMIHSNVQSVIKSSTEAGIEEELASSTVQQTIKLVMVQNKCTGMNMQAFTAAQVAARNFLHQYVFELTLNVVMKRFCAEISAIKTEATSAGEKKLHSDNPPLDTNEEIKSIREAEKKAAENAINMFFESVFIKDQVKQIARKESAQIMDEKKEDFKLALDKVIKPYAK